MVVTGSLFAGASLHLWGAKTSSVSGRGDPGRSVRTQGSGAAKALILASRCQPSDTKWVGFSPFRLPR